MDDFIIDQLQESQEIIPNLLKSTIQDLTAEENSVKSAMKILLLYHRSMKNVVL
jgi:hypothetical protein